MSCPFDKEWKTVLCQKGGQNLYWPFDYLEGLTTNQEIQKT